MQLQWPVNLSGMGVGSAEVHALIGRVAALAQCLPTARDHLRRLFPEASEEEILAAVPLQEAQQALDDLRENWGIEVDVDGNLATGREARLDLRQ
eukprot:6403532-Karenia_brevis.AAC.1